MKRNLTLLALAALATGLIAAGCGDDDDDDASSDTGTEATELTHEQFVTEANRICKQGNAELAQEGPDAGPGSPAFESFVTDTLVPNVQGQIADIRALGIPEEDESLNATLDEAEGITEDIAANPASITEGDPFAPINDELTAAGLTECAS
jgi:hypothetical protein